MSKKPVNFYQGAKGTFRIDIVQNVISPSHQMMTRATHTYDEIKQGMMTRATHTYDEIKQAIEDGFLPYVTQEKLGVTEYFHLCTDSNNERFGTNLLFSNTNSIVSIDKHNVVNVTPIEHGSGGSGDTPELLHYLNTISYAKTTETTIPANTSTSVTLTRQSGTIPSEYDFKAITGISVGNSLVSINAIDTSNTQQITMQIINNTSSEIVIPANTITIEIKYIRYLLQ